MTPIRLSICIATLNRGAFIGATLDSIVSQATDEVELVIVDGASTDNTEQVVRQYQQRFPRLRYLRLESKGGVDQDYCRAVELAQGDYCWLMSDDDLLKPGAIPAVLTETRQGYSLIIVNAEVRTANLARLIEARRLPTCANQVYRPAERPRLLIETAGYLSFIGGVVIQRRVWAQREKERYLGTAFIHVGVIFQSPLPADALVIAEPWVIIRYGNALWTPKAFEIWLFKWADLIWSFAGLPDAAKSQVVRREPWRRLRTLLRFRGKGTYSLQDYERWLEPRLRSPWRRLAAKSVARLPSCAINLLCVVYYSIIRPSALELADYRQSRYYFRNCLRRIGPRTGLSG